MKRLLLFLLLLAGFTGYSQVPDLMRCDYDHNETEVFFVGVHTNALIMSQGLGNYTVSYHASLADAESNSNALPLYVEVHGLQMVVYARIENSDTHNFVVDSFDLYIAMVPDPQMQPLTIICPSGSIMLDSHLPPDPALHFSWSYNNQVLIGAYSNTFEATFPGTYSVSVSYGSGCSGSAATEVVESAPPSEVSTIVNGETITVITNGNGLYEYSIDNGPFQASPIFQNIPAGPHNITVRDAFGCGSISLSVLGVDKNNFAAFSCAPNPVHNLLKISNSQPIDKITVTNALGAIVQEKTGHDAETTLDFSNRNSGLYILKIESADQQKVVKVLRE